MEPPYRIVSFDICKKIRGKGHIIGLILGEIKTCGIGTNMAIETAGVLKTVEQTIGLVRPASNVIIAGLSQSLQK